MPLPQYEYDDYEYGRIKRPVNTVSRVSASRNISNSKKENNKQSVRNALRGDAGVEKSRNNARNKTTTTTVSKTRSSKAKAELDVPIRRSNANVQSPNRKTTSSINTTKKVASTNTTRKVSASRLNKASQNRNMKKASFKKPKEMSLKNAEVVRNTKVIAKKKANVLRNVMISLSVFSILFLICYRSSLINESFKDLKSVKRNLEQTENMNAQIESEIQTQTDLSNIESYAKYQLGMQKPKDSQIRKVVVPKKDKISTPVVIEEEKENFWSSLLNDMINILD